MRQKLLYCNSFHDPESFQFQQPIQSTCTWWCGRVYIFLQLLGGDAGDVRRHDSSFSPAMTIGFWFYPASVVFSDFAVLFCTRQPP